MLGREPVGVAAAFVPLLLVQHAAQRRLAERHGAKHVRAELRAALRVVPFVGLQFGELA
jgi:hypothetical protein